MNYIELHIGDYDKDTAHLSACEDGIYGRLLRRYYNTEHALPGDVKAVQRLVRAHSKDEKKAVETVLAEFFSFIDGEWVHGRCDKEIAKYQAKQDKARSSANARWAKAETDSERNANAMRTHSDGNAHQTPDTRHQARADQKKGGASAPDLPEWLPADVWQDWHAYRNSRKGWTAKARALSLQTLTTLWRDGHDPRAVIEQAIERGWTGLFPVKSDQQARAGPPPQPVGKQMQGLMALEAMKSGNRMAAGRDSDWAAKAPLLVAGSHPGG